MSVFSPIIFNNIKKYAKLSCVALCSFSLIACSTPLVTPIKVDQPQNVYAYTNPATLNKPVMSAAKQRQEATRFLTKFFAPWDDSKYDNKRRRDILAGQKGEVRHLYRYVSYGSNFQPHTKAWIAQVEKQANLKAYPARNQYAIVVNNTPLRALPTAEPAFNDFRRAGEGYPFDNFQYSALWVGTPLRIVHVSRDGAWLLVMSPAVTGWVNATDVATVNHAFIQRWKTGHYVALATNQTPIRDEQGIFRFNARLGTLLPKQNGHILMPIKDANNQAVIRYAQAKPSAFVDFPLSGTPKHFAEVINSTLGEPYGWGGIHGFRDCSQTMLDVFTPFGVWLPRNSRAQLNSRPHNNVSEMSANEKEKYIVKDAQPFMTLVGMPGHIMLYIGAKDGHAIVFHDMWGLGTGGMFNQGRGRAVVGQTVITNLDFGKHVPHALGSLLQGAQTVTSL